MAECAGLLNRYRCQSLSRVRIPFSPLIFSARSWLSVPKRVTHGSNKDPSMNVTSITRVGRLFAGICVVSSFARADDQLSKQQLEFFEKRIRPVLVQHCYECHSPKAKKPKGGLRLDLRETWRRGGDSGPAIIPGKADTSLLIKAVRYESLEMPPKGKLPDRVIADLVKWVEIGAPDPRTGKPERPTAPSVDEGRNHWAFRPIKVAKLPDASDRTWPKSDIDYFILNRLEREKLRPANDTNRYTWLRRVSFDLTGLPPSVEQIEAFSQDNSPQAFESVVERLLSSRAFGERWARHWLDLVGYADQIGTSNNLFAEHAWKYRDYVIDSFNSGKPFDRFIREQIAGDLLQYESVEQHAAGLTATGFLVLGDLEVVEADKAKLRVDIIDQQVHKVSTAFLGMTIACARCHDHKFDPIPQRDYYAIAGFFYNTDSVYKTARGVWSDVTEAELPETEAQQAARTKRTQRHAEKLTAMKEELSQATKRKREFDELLNQTETGKDNAAARKSDKDSNPVKKPSRESLTKERNEVVARIAKLKKHIEHAEFFAPKVPRVYGVKDVEHPSNMKITIRGNPRALGDEVPRGFLQVASSVPPVIPTAASGRKQLADWIASRDNPLTARVTVNRIWQKLFGQGIVRTVDYFGVRGEKPSHPELLDHLAAKFMNDGWSQKRLIRSIVLSRIYRTSSEHHPRANAADPDNRLLWRMNRRRLDAESLRDAMLAVSGQLQPSSGGSAIPLEFPENVANINPENVNPPSFQLAKWRPEQAKQRTIYLPVIRSSGQPGPAELRNVFDFTQPAQFSGQRAITAVPTQALFLMNSPVVKDHAKNLAQRLENEATETAPRLDRLWLFTLNRPISEEEKRDARKFLTEAGSDGWAELCHALIASNEFLMRL